MREAKITRGRPMPFVDTLGNVLAIPNKLLFLSADFESHFIDEQVERDVRSFIDRHELVDVQVRLNEYDPIGELGRLLSNPRVSLLFRLTLGPLAWLAYLLNIGRLFGGDHYNPFSDTVNLYSNSRSIALHEMGHVLDFHRFPLPGVYAIVRMVPVVSLWQEYIASSHAVEHLRHLGEHDEEMRAYRLLFPAYSTYVFGALLEWFPSTLTRSLLFPVIGLGHLAGEWFARKRIGDLGVEDPGRRGDLDRATRMFAVSSPSGREHWGTLAGLVAGSSLCGLLAPFGAWLGFALARANAPAQR